MSICRVVLSGTILGQRCQNVLHFKNIDGLLTHVQIRDELVANWLPTVRNLQNAAWTWTDIAVQDRLDSTPDLLTVHPLTSQAGVLSGPPGLTFAGGIFSIRTFTAGRHGHGRFYLPGLHADSITNGALGTSSFADYQTRANNLKTRYCTTVNGFQLGVAPRAHPADFIPATDIIVRQNLGVQRRRNLGVGG